MVYKEKAKNIFGEFKAFALKGNAIDLAVAVVIGGAFGKIVSSLANNIIMPFAGALAGGVNVASLSVWIGKAEVSYGVFLQSVIDFTIVSVAIFVAVKIFSRLQRKEEEKQESKKPAEPSEEVKLLTEIRDALKNK